VPLFPEEEDFCAPHALARIDNSGDLESLRDREPDDPTG
jgi:hypothetical protein